MGAATLEARQDAEDVIGLYLDVLATDLAGLRLGDIDELTEASRDKLTLPDIYVPLHVTTQCPADMTLPEFLAADLGRIQQARGEHRPVTALEALSHHSQLTLLGKPGSGKSTFGASVLLTLAQGWQGRNGDLTELGTEWTHGSLFPLRIILRRFAEFLDGQTGEPSAQQVWAYLGTQLDAAGYALPDQAVQLLRRIVRQQGALVLFDGLDECGSPQLRARVHAAIDAFMKTAGKRCRYLLTARPYAWPDGAEADAGVYQLADLDDHQIEQFVRAWYEGLARHKIDVLSDPAQASRKIDDLLSARQRPDLRSMATNPLLLTLMATLHSNEGHLPDDRVDLYDKSVKLLLLKWNRKAGADVALLAALDIPDLKLADLRESLTELAFALHSEQQGDAAEGPADVGEDRLIRELKPLLGDSRDKAALVVEYIERRAGLLVGQGERRGERQFSFPHRTFQEFLAACHLADSEDFADECVCLAKADAGHWQEVLPMAARRAGTKQGAVAADWLVGLEDADVLKTRPPTEHDWNGALLAALALKEIGLANVRKHDRPRRIAARVAGWLVAMLPRHPTEGGATAKQRATAGDLLAHLGDPRFDPERFHLPRDAQLGFAEIPADPSYCIGTRRADQNRVAAVVDSTIYDTELNDDATTVPSFFLARHLVTVAQFQVFVTSTGLAIGDSDALSDPSNRPVRYVSWHEAKAYCDWLTEKLRSDAALSGSQAARLVREQGWSVDLPSELEWERAARAGLAGAIFAWGDEPDPERANYAASNIDNTSCVGCFPANGLGLHDMIGNVWEWTRSLHGFAYPYEASNEGREDPNAADERARVVRGGAFDLDPYDARCAYRSWVGPRNRFNNLGFRVVLRSSPVL